MQPGALVDEVVARLAPAHGPLPTVHPPTASVMNGAAGYALALSRLGALRNDARLLDAAGSWSRLARSTLGRSEAFWNPDLGIVADAFGERSLFHTASGVHCVDALLSVRRGDGAAADRAVGAFVDEVGRGGEHVDVLFGRAGLLLGCALLLDALPEATDRERVRAVGATLHRGVCRELGRLRPVAVDDEVALLGAGHGWAGVLLAVLRWSEAADHPPVTGTVARLEELARLAEPEGRGLRWPYRSGETAAGNTLHATWCNGAAGFVQLWTVARRSLGDAEFGVLADRAAWTALDGPEEPGDLCCGLAGRAYALLSRYRSGSPEWLPHARELGIRAAEQVRRRVLRRDSLYKGDVGVALLLAELDSPDRSGMPLVETEPLDADTAR